MKILYDQSIISVVIVTVEKDKKHLKRSLVSLEKSSEYADIRLEIIIVSNGTTLPNINYLVNSYKVIHFAQKKNFSQAINDGIRETKGRWCILLAPDTITHRDTIRNLLIYTCKPSIGVITPKILLAHGLDYTLNSFPSLWTIFLEQSYLYKLPFSLFKLPNSDSNRYQYTQNVDAAASTFWFIQKEIFWKIGGFDPEYCFYFEDFDLCKRLKTKGYKILFVSNAKVTHIPHQSNNGVPFGNFYIDSLHKYLNKYYPKIYVLLTLFIFLTGSLIRLVYWNIKIIISNNSMIKVYARKKISFYQNVLWS